MPERSEQPEDFARLFERLPIGAYRSTPEGRQLRANLALARLNGYDSPAEQVARVHDIAAEWYVQPGRRAEFMALLERDGEVRGFVSEVFRHRTRERIWVSENAYVVRDTAGRALYYEGTVEEVTGQVSAREALRASEENLRLIAAHVPGALYRIRLHADGRREIDFVSEGVRALLGIDPAEATRDFGRIGSFRHPEDRERVRAEVEAANRDGLSLLTEYRVVLADGREKWIQQTSSPAAGAEGARVRVGVMLDISARRQAEAQLRASEQRWKLALESTGDGVWDVNLATGEEQFSLRTLQMYGFEPGDLERRGETLDGRTHPDDVPAMLQARADHLAGRAPSYVNEHRVRCQDGSWKWVLSRGMVIERDAAGRPLRMIGTHTDITERREAEALRLARDRAESASRATTAFLSRVSHELRTPLNAILGFAQLLQMEAGDAGGAPGTTRGLSERQRGYLRQVLASGEHLLALVDDILDLSSVQTGQLPMQLEALPLRPVVEEVYAMLDHGARDAGVAIVDEVPPGDALTVLADRRRLKQVVANLLSNAIKYNRRGGWVRLGARAVDGRIELAVADSGIGMDEQQLARLFQPFERLGAQRGPVAGSGLGLALARQLAEAMRGSIAVRSMPGEGSVFTLRLPAAA
jgi:PAS domain S-box-containing protein